MSVPGEPVPRTRHEVEELGYTVQEVEHLRNEKQDHGLAEVAQDAHHRKGHASKIAEGVANKYTRWVPAPHYMNRLKRKQNDPNAPRVFIHSATAIKIPFHTDINENFKDLLSCST